MVKDSIKSLREPVAWILVSVVAAEFLIGMWQLLDKPDNEYQQESWFLYNSYYASGDFVGFSYGLMLTIALLLVTVLPDRLPRAKPIVLIVVIESGVLLLLGILTMFLGLFYQEQSTTSGTSYGPDVVDKAQSFLGDLPSLALTLVPLLVALAMVRSPGLSGGPRQQPPQQPQPGGYYAAPPQQPYPGQPYPQQQQPYPQQGSFPEWGGPQHGGYGQGW